MEMLADALRTALGIALLISSLGKFRDLPGFVEVVVNYQVLPRRLASSYGVVVPVAEAAIGGLLIVGYESRIVASVAIMLLTTFAVALAINLRRHRSIPCGCRGAADSTLISAGSLGRVAILMLFAGTAILFGSQHAITEVPARQLGTSVALVIIALLCASSFVELPSAFRVLRELAYGGQDGR